MNYGIAVGIRRCASLTDDQFELFVIPGVVGASSRSLKEGREKTDKWIAKQAMESQRALSLREKQSGQFHCQALLD